jgi:hypothetical protein
MLLSLSGIGVQKGVFLPSIPEYDWMIRSPRRGTVSLEAFVQEHDNIVYGMTSRLSDSPPFGGENSSLHALRDLVNLHIVNSFSSISALHRHLDALDIMNPERLRPSWDTYFMVSPLLSRVVSLRLITRRHWLRWHLAGQIA